MMPAASASTESVSWRERPLVASIIRRISTRRRQSPRPRPQRRQHSLPADATRIPAHPVPVGQEPKTWRTEELIENITASPHPSGTASSGVHGSNQPKAESGKETSPPVGVDDRILAASSSQLEDTAGGVEQPAEEDMGATEGERLTSSKVYLCSSGDNTGREGSHAPRSISSRLQHVKNRAFLSICAAIPRYTVGGFKIGEPTQTASELQLPNSNSIGNELPHSQAEQVLTAAALSADGRQRKTPDARNSEETAKESEEMKKLRRELSESQYQITELQRRCEARSRDLENSSNFMNTADTSSDSDIIQALQRLNAELQQTATYMVDCLAEDLEFSIVRANPSEEQSLAVQRTSEHVGQVLVKSFGTGTSEDIPMLLQIAFQAYLASALCQTASSWAYDPGYNAFVGGIYQRLRRVEAQAISGRWRALTRVHIVHNWISDPESLVEGIVAGLSDILLTAGCTATLSDVISKVTSKFEGKITLLVKLAGRLNKLFDEVISSDFEVFVVRPGERFKSKMMEDADGGQIGVQDGPVLCATHLGLTKRMPMEALWEKGRKQKMMVLKAKVLLESFLNTEN